MSDNDLDGLVGTYVVAVWHRRTWEAITAVVDALGAVNAKKLKLASGEHLAAVLITTFLRAPPIEVDLDGGTDLVFRLAASPNATRRLTGRDDTPFVDVEVKSLRGRAREFYAGIDKAVRRGQEPRQITINTQVTTVEGLMDDARDMIGEAAEQLARKSSPDRARNVFLITHPFDHFYVEMADFFVAQHLAPLTDLPDTVDAVWLLAFPSHLVVWSVADQQWTSLYFAGQNGPEDEPTGADEDLEFLVAVDLEFRDQLGISTDSPYGFKLTFNDADE